MEKGIAPSIAELNDTLRTTGQGGGQILITRGVADLREDLKAQVIAAIQTFDNFNEDNDPYKEHDLGIVEINGERFMWKVDYYNKDMSAGSEDPANPGITQRVMTIMAASEY